MAYGSLLWILSSCTAATRDETHYTSIAALKQSFEGYSKRITGDVNLRLWINGSDRFGNFSKTITAQDQTGGIEIKADCDELFRYFPLRAVITVRCQGLWLGASGGGFCLGSAPTSGYAVDFIPENEITMYINVTDLPPVTFPARRVEIGGLSGDMISTLVSFSDVEFIEEETALTWGEKDASVSRHIIDRKGDTLEIYVSSGAQFATKQLPTGSGSIEGILNYYSGRYSLRPAWDRAAEMQQPRF